jgi:hypothetical protein
VDGAEVGEGPPGQRVDRLPARCVGRHRDDVGAGELRGRLLQPPGVDVGHDDAHALGDEALAEGEADAPGGAGDDRDAAAKLVHQTW